MSDPNARRFSSEEELLSIAVIGERRSTDENESAEFILGQRPLDHAPGLYPNGFDKCLLAEREDTPNLHKFRWVQTGDHVTW